VSLGWLHRRVAAAAHGALIIICRSEEGSCVRHGISWTIPEHVYLVLVNML